MTGNGNGSGNLAGSARTVTTIAEVRAAADAVRAAGGRVGFFGTSGALHEGHLTVIRRMAAECDLSIMPLFLAPVPGVTSDAVPAYDRDFDADAALAFDAGVNLVFRPAVAQMYPDLPVRTAVVPADELAAPWENAEDPSFMRMAATALAKYYNIVGPCRAYTGEKDWVPLTVLRRMVVDLSIRAEIVACPVVRLADGLCASSRNRRLSGADRAAAPALYAALRAAVAAVEAGERDAEAIRTLLRRRISAVAPVDYAEVVDAATLARVDPLVGELRLLVSADFTGTHLFDNVGVTVPDPAIRRRTRASAG
ncbi:pantoate--beta-alanine ligase [Frankia gtarii]|uniref:pantoate--beta-alanine ligase n=1 Tax=Frankia gtarii TaxID=2950102 RepID=UPI0021C1C46D|nr:pantoate--beta-alanine ligase [Frankia gtarii]